MNENLNQMINQCNEKIFSSAGAQSTTFTFDDVKFDPESNVHVPVKDEKNNTETVSISFATETDLIQHARETMYKADVAILLSYWEIGRSINSFYKGKVWAQGAPEDFSRHWDWERHPGQDVRVR